MIETMWTYLKAWTKSEEGAETVEYALVVGLFAIAAIVAMIVAGDAIETMFNAIATAINISRMGRAKAISTRVAPDSRLCSWEGFLFTSVLRVGAGRGRSLGSAPSGSRMA